MTTLPPLRNASDAYVSEKNPSTNYNTAQRIYLADGSAANTRYGYIYFGVPSGMSGTQIVSAKLRLYSGAGFAGAVTLSLQRLAAKFSVNRINWNNKPGVTGAVKSLTKTGAASGTMWEFDVKDVMQQIADGLPWYGFRISATNSTAKWLYSAQGPEEFRPVLEIVWSDAPDQPENLVPDDGMSVSVAKPTLKWSFTDPSGDTTMQSAHLKLFSTQALADANGAGDLLDITVPTTTPQFDLDDPAAAAYGGVAAGGTVYWRVQNVDGAGIPSAWSDVARFTRTTKGALTITNPSAGSPTVHEATPPFSWTFTGRTQLSYEIFLSTPEEPEKRLWTATAQSTDTAVTPPAGVITVPGKTYRVTVRIVDTIDRADLPDDPIYVEAYQDFTFDLTNTVGTVTGLTGTADVYRSRMVLEWDRDTAPDAFVILRNGNVVAEVAPEDLLVAGTHYRYKDDEARPRKTTTWSVAAKVNGQTSSGNPTVTGKVKPITSTLTETDNDRTVYLFDPAVDAERDESSEIHYVMGDAPPVLITQSLRGYAGSVSGMLLNDTVPGVSASSQLDDLIWFREHPGQVVKLVWVDKVMRVVVRNVTDEPIAYPDGTAEYRVSFEFFQVG
jgi:hypothetical protein